MTNRLLNPFYKAILFLIIFGLISFYLSEVFIPKWEGIDDTRPAVSTFYKQPKDSIDVLFLGTSSIRNGISPLTIWEETGITSYLRATAGQHPIVTYYYLLESLEYQHPKIVVLDGISLFYNFNVDDKESSIRKSVDPMKMSLIKTQLIMDIISESENQSFLSYFIPLLRYHDRWKEINQNDFQYSNNIDTEYFRGQYITRSTKSLSFPENYMTPTTEAAEYKDKALYYFEKTIQLCKENDIEIIFVSLPRIKSYIYARHLAIKQLAEKYSIPLIDYNLPPFINIIEFNPSNDLENSRHLNIYGSQKVSSHLGAYLQENFHLIDKRNDPEFKQWNLDSQNYHSNF